MYLKVILQTNKQMYDWMQGFTLSQGAAIDLNCSDPFLTHESGKTVLNILAEPGPSESLDTLFFIPHFSLQEGVITIDTVLSYKDSSI